MWFSDFAEEGFVEAIPGIFGQRHRLGIAENFHGLFAGVDHQAAILALCEMDLEVGEHRRIHFAIQIFRKFLHDVFALHWLSPLRKYRFSF